MIKRYINHYWVQLPIGGVLDSTNLRDSELQAVEAWSPLKIFKAKRDANNVIQFPTRAYALAA